MKTIKLFISYGIIPVLIIEYFFLMFGFNIHRILVTPMILLMDMLSFILIIKTLLSNNTTGTRLFMVWFIINIMSAVAYRYNGMPFSCYISMLRPYIFPMFFFLLGIDKDVDKSLFYKYYLIASVFSFVVGIILYFTTPSFYLEYLSGIISNNWQGGNSSVDYIVDTFRMGSFFGSSYAISFLSVPAMCIALGNTLKKGAHENWLMFIVSIISWLSALLCQQRVAMAFSTFVIIYYYIISRSRVNGTYILTTGIVVGVIGIIAIIGTNDRYSFVLESLKNRTEEMSFIKAYEGSRTNQVVSTIAATDNFILGDGIGARSSQARKIGKPGVSDVEYIRLLSENGIIGLLLFLLITLCSIIRVFSCRREFFTEIMIIGFFLFAMIGSNALSINHLYSTVFWFSLGTIWKRYKINNK